MSATERSLGKGAAVVTLATLASRVTGLLRVVAVAYAMGATFLANTYNSANTAPNLVFELAAAGILTSVFVPTFVEYIVRDRQQEGWAAANALTSVALIGLIAIAAFVGVAAPWIMRGFLIGVEQPVRDQAINVGTDLLRLFAPQIVFYGAGMIMTAALHAHRRFGMAAIAPIFNNVVVIGVYLAYAAMRNGEPALSAITTSEIWLLGAGTTAGVVAMTACLIPALRSTGWSFRFRWDPRHPAVRKGARLGAWALGYAGGYQAVLIVVLILANRVEGGVAAYQWAYTFFFLPHALFGVPIFHVLFTAMSEHVARGEEVGIVTRLRDGLAMLGFILIPIAVSLAVLSEQLGTLTLGYGEMTSEGVRLVSRCLTAFAVGLPTYSVFLTFTRAFYALGDARTPALVNAAAVVVAAAAGSLLFFGMGEGTAVEGLAYGHSIGFSFGCVVLGLYLTRRLGSILDRDLTRTLLRSCLLAAVAGVVMSSVGRLIDPVNRAGIFVEVAVAGGCGAIVYLVGARLTGSTELARVTQLITSLKGRGR